MVLDLRSAAAHRGVRDERQPESQDRARTAPRVSRRSGARRTPRRCEEHDRVRLPARARVARGTEADDALARTEADALKRRRPRGSLSRDTQGADEDPMNLPQHASARNMPEWSPTEAADRDRLIDEARAAASSGALTVMREKQAALEQLKARVAARSGVDAVRWGEARHPVTGAVVEMMTPEERVTFHERKLAYHNKAAAKRAELRAAGFTVRRTQHQITIEGAQVSELRRRLATARIDVAHLARSLRVPRPRPRLPRVIAARAPRRARARRAASRPAARSPDPPAPAPPRSSGAAAPSWGAQ